ncbi:MAG: carboxypeptidase M32, partial [Armatimonadota bacterium]
MRTMSHYDNLLRRLADIQRLNQANAVLGWDQQCYMPHGGGAARAAQMAVLGRVAHEMFV